MQWTRAEGKLKTELRHQFLVEKSLPRFDDRKNNLNRKRLRTKKKLFGRMLRQLTRRNNSSDSSTALLVENQNTAQARFASTFKDVDLQLFRSGTGSKSKYSKKYSENTAAIEGLVARLNHRMSSPINLMAKRLLRKIYTTSLGRDRGRNCHSRTRADHYSLYGKTCGPRCYEPL